MKAHGKIVDSEDLGALSSGHIFVVDSAGELVEPRTMETTDSEGDFSIEVMPRDRSRKGNIRKKKIRTSNLDYNWGCGIYNLQKLG